MTTRRDVAGLLEVPYPVFVYILYEKKNTYYKEFTLKKKTGGTRVIQAPLSGLKILQQKLSYILYLIHHQRAASHGFNKGKSIKTNAIPHVGCREVFNIDLEDFFPSINFGRVRGLFLSKPFSFNKEVATTLAQICCFGNSIPQGAPTSPVISNMICTKLDHDLHSIAQKNHCTYTRYADDITFSANIKLSKDIVKVYPLDGKHEVVPGDVLKDVVQLNGFKINDKKNRLQAYFNRQIVAGVVVNEKLNVKRTLVRQVRAMLHAWDKYQLPAAESEYFAKYFHQKQRGYKRKTKFVDVVRGKINFIKQIKGEDDIVWRRLQNKLLRLAKGYTYDKYPVTNFEQVQDYLWVVQCENSKGTGFVLKDLGLVTCYHVIEQFFDNRKPIKIYRSEDFASPFYGSVIMADKDLDLAVLKIHGIDEVGALLVMANLPHFHSSAINTQLGDKIKACGFPDYRPGKRAFVYNVEVASFETEGGLEHIKVMDLLYGGMSGGPALNEKNEVVGILAKGIRMMEQLNQTADFSIIPVGGIEALKSKNLQKI